MKKALIRAAAVLAVAGLAAVAASAAFAGHHASATASASASGACNAGSGPETPQGVSGLDAEWLKTSVQGDVFEIRGGHIALRKTSNSAVGKLAHRLISDHTKSLQDAEKLAAEYGIKLEKVPTPSEQWELEKVAQWSGKAFDLNYSSLEVRDHQQDIQETSDEVGMGCDREIVSDAKQEIPMLKLHLELSKQAHEAAKAE
jgi:predicted outer membrane protein